MVFGLRVGGAEGKAKRKASREDAKDAKKSTGKVRMGLVGVTSQRWWRARVGAGFGRL